MIKFAQTALVVKGTEIVEFSEDAEGLCTSLLVLDA